MQRMKQYATILRLLRIHSASSVHTRPASLTIDMQALYSQRLLQRFSQLEICQSTSAQTIAQSRVSCMLAKLFQKHKMGDVPAHCGQSSSNVQLEIGWQDAPADCLTNYNTSVISLSNFNHDLTQLNTSKNHSMNSQQRSLHTARQLLDDNKAQKDSTRHRILIDIIADESKVEQQVKYLITQKLREQKNPAYTLLIDKRAVDELERKAKAVTLQPLYKRIWTKQFWINAYHATKHEIQHYKAGFQLLWTDMRLSFRYLRKVLNGKQLTRRERKQTSIDASEVETISACQTHKLAGQKAELRVKLDMAKFLQETIEDMALKKMKSKDSKEQEHSSLADEFAKFLEENRKTGHVRTTDLLRFAPLFKDNLTLDTLDAPQLRALCKLLNVPPFGSNAMLRFQLRTRLRSLHADDLIISKEGVASLSTSELQAACRERGMRALGMSAEGLRQRLQQWLQSYLFIAHVENVPQPERIRAVLETLPEDLLAQVQAELLETEGEGVDAKLRLKIITAEEERIKRERIEKEQEEEKEREKERAKEAMEHLPEPSEQPMEDRSSMQKKLNPEAPKDEQLVTTPASTATKQHHDKLTLEDCLDLALVISQLSGQKQVAPAFQSLKNEVKEHKEDLEELHEYGEGKLRASAGSLRLSNRVERMLQKVELSVSEIDSAGMAKLDLDRDGVISRAELMSAMSMMKKSPSTEKMQRWADILDADHDGKLKLDTLQKVLNMIAHEGMDVHPDHLQAIVDLIEKTDRISSEEDVPNNSDAIRKKEMNETQNAS